MASNIAPITSGDPMELQIKKRIVAIAREAIVALSSIASCDAYPYEDSPNARACPFVRAHTGARRSTQDTGASSVVRVDRAFLLDVVTSFAQDGFRGESSALLDAILTPLEIAFYCQSLGKQMKSEQFPDTFIYHYGNTITSLNSYGLRATSDTGLIALDRTGAGAPIWGARFTIEVSLSRRAGGTFR